MAMPVTAVRMDLADAERLSDATVQEWFARRATDTMLDEVDKRLVTLLARKKLAEAPQSLMNAIVADAVAHALMQTLYK
jgi:hypothetical protein